MGCQGDEFMIEMSDGVHAMILSGGGAYGAYEVGVMKALFSGESPATGYRPLNAGIFCGTSVGALNAAFMTAQPGVDSASTASELENIWINEISDNPKSCGNGIYRFRGDPLGYLDPACITAHRADPFAEAAGDATFFAQYWLKRGTSFLAAAGPLPQRALQLVDLSAFISTEPLKQQIKRIMRFDRVRSADRVLRVAATNWQTGQVKIFENEEMTDALAPLIMQASAAIPGVFPPVEIAGNTYVDGGVVMNTPLRPAIHAGATTLHVVYLDPDVRSIPIQRLQNTLDTMMKTYTILQATIANEDITTASWINDGLEVIERVSRGELPAEGDLLSFVRVAGEIEQAIRRGFPYRKLTIHRYRPEKDLGGPLGMLNFRQPVILESIERALDETINHDCDACQCVLPGAV